MADNERWHYIHFPNGSIDAIPTWQIDAFFAQYTKCRCGRQVNKHGRTCCLMCWNGYGPGCHSRLCRKRNE